MKSNFETSLKEYMKDVEDLKLAAEYLEFLFSKIDSKSYDTGEITISFKFGMEKYIEIVKLLDHLERSKYKYNLNIGSNENN